MIFSRDQLYRVVCNIRIPSSPGQENIGTGMFVAKGSELYLITASHVAEPHNSQTAIIFCDDKGNATRMMLSHLSGVNQWVHHSVADLAYIKINLTSANESYLINRFYPYDQIELNRQPVSKDIELTTIGFPLGLGSTGNYSPLSFRTFSASSFITLNRADNKHLADFFILESPSVGGYSGGPVFDLGYIISGIMSQHKEKTVCFGFMHGTISDETGGKLAAVTPAHYINGWI